MKKMLLGNQAVAWGALAAGVDVVSGYPGTPSSEVIPEIMKYAQNNDQAPYVEWSTNEKVAVEVAAAAAWSGKRSMATMKMSGINVAADSVLSIAYSGTRGGLIIYIADDPGVEAGMPEQDSRVFAQWAGLPVLECETPQQAYDLVQFAFELSEEIELPVIVRTVTSVAHVLDSVESPFSWQPLNREPSFERDIFRFTKAGSAICMDQHRDLLKRLDKAEEIVAQRKTNRRVDGSGTLGVISAGNINPFVEECVDGNGEISVLYLQVTYPLDRKSVGEILDRCDRIAVLEELEPVVEKMVRSEATIRGWSGTIIGKLDGHLSRVGKYTQSVINRGLSLLSDGRFGNVAENGSVIPDDIPPAKHPITFCAGCPHRGTYVALNRALKKTKLGQKETIVTGDIGCTILGMNPPFDSCWTEVSMGSSIGMAQGFNRAGFEKPVVATIGDSTFFHAGIPPLINAVQHQTDLLLIILDNGWTSMTGFQVNPGTDETMQQSGDRRVDIQRVVESFGVDSVDIVYPFQQDETVDTLSRLLLEKGVRVVISKEECALTRQRREPRTSYFTIDPDKCTWCKACLRETGCPALMPAAAPEGHKKEQVMAIDPALCTGCGLCFTCCKFDAISEVKEESRG